MYNYFYSACKNFADAANPSGCTNFMSEFSHIISGGMTKLYEAGARALENSAHMRAHVAHKLSAEGAAYLQECSDICKTVSSELSNLASNSAHCASQKCA